MSCGRNCEFSVKLRGAKKRNKDLARGKINYNCNQYVDRGIVAYSLTVIRCISKSVLNLLMQENRQKFNLSSKL